MSGTLFGFTGSNPNFYGLRTDIRGRLGKTLYTVQSNTLKLSNQDWATRLDSLAVLEHPVTDRWTVFAGRQRFYRGPVMRNLMSSQLIADRYSGAGVSGRTKQWTAEAAWLYDANSEGRGAQGGAMASLEATVKGAMLGAHYLHADGLTKGDGYTGSYSLSLIRDEVETYGEVGTGVDGMRLETYGLYFPGIYQRFDLDTYIEYGRHGGMGSAVSLSTCKQATKSLSLRINLDWLEQKKLTLSGGTIFQFDIIRKKAQK